MAQTSTESRNQSVVVGFVVSKIDKNHLAPCPFANPVAVCFSVPLFLCALGSGACRSLAVNVIGLRFILMVLTAYGFAISWMALKFGALIFDVYF